MESVNKPRKPIKRIQVHLKEQMLEAIEDDRRVFRFNCVTGDADHPTEPGIFHVDRKHEIYRSKKYDAQMNFAMFFSADGKAIHQYHGPVPISILRRVRTVVTDEIGSKGCVRLSESDAKSLFEWTPRLTQVRIA